MEEITEAFEGVELGEGASFHEAFVIDNYRIEDRNHELRIEARAKDTEARWQEVPDELITDRGSQVLIFLDPQGFQYYIPAFLVWYLRHIDSQDMDFSSDTFERIDYHLLGGFEVKVADHFLARFSILSPQQSQAVAHFLEFLILREDKVEAEDEAERQVEIACGEMTEAQAQHWREASQRARMDYDHSAQALKRYWGQFLPTAT